MDEITRHGTAWFYRRGCRCAECRAANTAAARRYREAHREQMRVAGRAYYAKNAETMRERDRERYQQPKRKADNKASSRRSYEANREERIASATVWNKANPHKRRRTWLKGRYGITSEDYDSMFVAQQGRCGICGDEPRKSLAVDHDHATGRVRGLLCIRCNAAIGGLKDDPELLRRAIAWLED